MKQTIPAIEISNWLSDFKLPRYLSGRSSLNISERLATLCRSFVQSVIDLALIQEPWVTHDILLCSEMPRGESILQASHKDVHSCQKYPAVLQFRLPVFCSRDLTTITISENGQILTLSSACLSYNLKNCHQPKSSDISLYSRFVE